MHASACIHMSMNAYKSAYNFACVCGAAVCIPSTSHICITLSLHAAHQSDASQHCFTSLKFSMFKPMKSAAFASLTAFVHSELKVRSPGTLGACHS